jgi:hypothetical protein
MAKAEGKKKRIPHLHIAVRRIFARMCMAIARFCIELSNGLLPKEDVVTRAMIECVQKKWIRKKEQTLALLRGVYKRHAMTDVFKSSYAGEDKHKCLIWSVQDIVMAIDEIRERYGKLITLCQTLEEFRILNFKLECEYAAVYGDVIRQIDAYQEYIEKRKASEEFIVEVKACRKDMYAFLQFAIVFETPETKRLTMLLGGIVKNWEKTRTEDSIDTLSSFYCKIERRRKLIDRLWERILPAGYTCYDEYDAAHGVWRTEPYAMR